MTHKIIVLGLLSLSIWLSSCSCTGPKMSADLLIENTHLFDGQKFSNEADLYIKDGKIERITYGEARLNGTYKEIISAEGMTVIPGLINAHLHIQEAKDLIASAQAGVLTVFDLLKIPEDSLLAYKTLGQLPQYAYYYSSGIGADMPDAVIKLFTGKQNPYAPGNIEEAKAFIKIRVEHGVDFIKIFQESRLNQTFPDSLFDALIDETHRMNLKATVHAQTLKDARYAVSHGADVLAHIWGDSLISTQELDYWSKKPLAISPTLLVNQRIIENHLPSGALTFEQLLGEVMKMHQAGIKVLAGTDAPNMGINFGHNLYDEIFFYAEAGMTIEEALMTATSNPAEAYKIKGRGTLKSQTSADFLLIRGDLQQDIYALRNLIGVWKNGIRIK